MKMRTDGVSEMILGFKSLCRGFGRFVTSIPEEILFCFSRDWDVSSEEVVGKKGERKTIILKPNLRFRSEKLVATDEPVEPLPDGQKDQRCGQRTKIHQVLVGVRRQRPDAGTLTLFFSGSALGNGVRWDACKPWEDISITIEFLEDAKFWMSIFGKALV